jgi:hypothetical protein
MKGAKELGGWGARENSQPSSHPSPSAPYVPTLIASTSLAVPLPPAASI